MAVELVRGARLAVEAATELFEHDAPDFLGDHTRYDVAPDGRFLIREEGPSEVITDLGLVLNAFAALEEGSSPP